jgi:hypothetical protein
MKRSLFFAFIFLTYSGFSQAKKKPVQHKKHGHYDVVVKPGNELAMDETQIVFTFIGPNNMPACHNVKIVCNNDSAFPHIDTKGNYKVELDPGKYKLRFSVPFWYEVRTDSITCKARTSNNIIVKFEAKDNPSH